MDCWEPEDNGPEWRELLAFLGVVLVLLVVALVLGLVVRAYCGPTWAALAGCAVFALECTAWGFARLYSDRIP